MELGVEDPMPALNAPAFPQQLQQGFLGGAESREEQVGGPEGLVVTRAGGNHLEDLAGADPVLVDVLWRLLGPMRPGDVAPVAFLMIHCQKRNLAFFLELAAHLAMQCLLVGLGGQEEVGPLFLELL